MRITRAELSTSQKAPDLIPQHFSLSSEHLFEIMIKIKSKSHYIAPDLI